MKKNLQGKSSALSTHSTTKPIPLSPSRPMPFPHQASSTAGSPPPPASDSSPVSHSFFGLSPLTICDSAISQDGRPRPLPAFKG